MDIASLKDFLSLAVKGGEFAKLEDPERGRGGWLRERCGLNFWAGCSFKILLQSTIGLEVSSYSTTRCVDECLAVVCNVKNPDPTLKP